MARTLLSAQSANVGTAARKLLPICHPERSEIIRFANDLAESKPGTCFALTEPR